MSEIYSQERMKRLILYSQIQDLNKLQKPFTINFISSF